MEYKAVLFCFLVFLTQLSRVNQERKGGTNSRCSDKKCITCLHGSCGTDCLYNCTGFCAHECDKRNCSCITCADGYYGDACSHNCSGRCYKAAESLSTLCERNGSCSDGCKYGFCLPNTTCSRRCSECVDDDCDAYTCKCNKGLKPGSKTPNDGECTPQNNYYGCCLGLGIVLGLFVFCVVVGIVCIRHKQGHRY